MPRPGPRREQVAVRLDDDMIAWLDHCARIHKSTRSEQIRQALEAQRIRDDWTYAPPHPLEAQG